MSRRTLLVAAAFFMPSELVWSMLASGLFHNALGKGYVLLQPQVLIGALLAVTVIGRRRSAVSLSPTPRQLLQVCAIFACAGVYESIATVIGDGDAILALQQAYFGFVYPVLIVIALAPVHDETAVACGRAFYWGYIGYLAVVAAALAYDGIFMGQVSSHGLGGALISFRYQYDGNEGGVSLVHLLLGNFNKQSNYLLLSLWLGPDFLRLRGTTGERVDRALYNVFAALAVLFLFLLFSRAAIFLLPLVLLANRKHLWALAGRWKYVAIGVCATVALLSKDALQTVLNYLLYSDYIDDSSMGMLGSFGDRLYQWNDVARLLSSGDTIIHGLGVGTYGVSLGLGPEAGSHNLFLDHLLASGIVTPSLILYVLILGTVTAIAKRNVMIAGTLFTFVALAFREYSFSYLYVSSMGGFLFIAIFHFLYFSPDPVREVASQPARALTRRPGTLRVSA
jgi:hypothetical protein